MKITAILLALLATSGCVTRQPMSLGDLDAALEKNKAAATRQYPGKSHAEVRAAAQQVMYLLDPSDMRFDVRGNELLATRFSTFYAVFSYGMGRDWYSIAIDPAPSGTKATFGLYGEMHTGLPSEIPISYRSSIPISAHDNPADFKLFHDRVEHILGLRPEWISCEAAKAAQPSPARTMQLCDLIGLENKSPDKK